MCLRKECHRSYITFHLIISSEQCHHDFLSALIYWPGHLTKVMFYFLSCEFFPCPLPLLSSHFRIKPICTAHTERMENYISAFIGQKTYLHKLFGNSLETGQFCPFYLFIIIYFYQYELVYVYLILQNIIQYYFILSSEFSISGHGMLLAFVSLALLSTSCGFSKKIIHYFLEL